MEVRMSPFSATTYPKLITQHSSTQARLFPQYGGTDSYFDIVIAGSGIGGGILADDLADRFASAGSGKRILVVEAGSYLFPTHVFNICRFPTPTSPAPTPCRLSRSRVARPIGTTSTSSRS
jgi:hypothetical protein